MKIETKWTIIEYCLTQNLTRSMTVSFRRIPKKQKQELYLRVYHLYSYFSPLQTEQTIYSPFFGHRSFYLSYVSHVDTPYKLFDACAKCISFYDPIMSTHLSDVKKKIMILIDIFGHDIGSLISFYSWGIVQSAPF